MIPTLIRESIIWGAVVQRCSVKKEVFKNLKKFTGKHLCESLLFNKVAGLRRNFCENFKNTSFYRTRLVAASTIRGEESYINYLIVEKVNFGGSAEMLLLIVWPLVHEDLVRFETTVKAFCHRNPAALCVMDFNQFG